MHPIRFGPFLGLVLLAACAGSGPSPSPVPSAATPQPSPTPPAAFDLVVVPAEEPVAARVAIPGERVCFLVKIEEASGTSAGPVTITATAEGAEVTGIRSASLEAGTVGEVWIVPDETTQDATVDVKITGKRGGLERMVERSVAIMPMPDERAADAQPHFERWLAWLIASQPQLGITEQTEWQPTYVSTFLVVSHYAYWSDEWEMVVSWHNMIPPHDWSEIYLRHRDTDSQPTLAFRTESLAGATEPHAVEPPSEVLR